MIPFLSRERMNAFLRFLAVAEWSTMLVWKHVLAIGLPFPRRHSLPRSLEAPLWPLVVFVQVLCAPSFLVELGPCWLASTLLLRCIFHGLLDDTPILTSSHSLFSLLASPEFNSSCILTRWPSLWVTILACHCRPTLEQISKGLYHLPGPTPWCPADLNCNFGNSSLVQGCLSSALEYHRDYSYTLFHHSLTMPTLYITYRVKSLCAFSISIRPNWHSQRTDLFMQHECCPIEDAPGFATSTLFLVIPHPTLLHLPHPSFQSTILSKVTTPLAPA